MPGRPPTDKLPPASASAHWARRPGLPSTALPGLSRPQAWLRPTCAWLQSMGLLTRLSAPTT